MKAAPTRTVSEGFYDEIVAIFEGKSNTKIETNKGYPVHIISLSGLGEYTIVGYISYDYDEPISWTKQGVSNHGNYQSDRDTSDDLILKPQPVSLGWYNFFMDGTVYGPYQTEQVAIETILDFTNYALCKEIIVRPKEI